MAELVLHEFLLAPKLRFFSEPITAFLTVGPLGGRSWKIGDSTGDPSSGSISKKKVEWDLGPNRHIVAAMANQVLTPPPPPSTPS